MVIIAKVLMGNTTTIDNNNKVFINIPVSVTAAQQQLVGRRTFRISHVLHAGTAHTNFKQSGVRTFRHNPWIHI